MVDVHMIIGLATVAAFLLLTIVNGLRAFRGSQVTWARGLSFAAAGLLVIQYVVGFSLLGDDHSIKPIHYILALVTLVPVGAEHMIAAQETDKQRAARTAFICNLATVILLAAVYEIGQRNA